MFLPFEFTAGSRAEAAEERRVVDVVGLHQGDEVRDERGRHRVVEPGWEPELGPHPGGPGGRVVLAERTERLDRQRHGGVLQQDKRRALYPYTQTYEYAGKTFHRRGFICLVKLTL